MKEHKTYYRAVFNQDAQKEINGTLKLFEAGDMFINRMSEANLQAFLAQKNNGKLINNSFVSFPTSYFDIHKITETITYESEKIDTNKYITHKI